jgi:four helix bundle protein
MGQLVKSFEDLEVWQLGKQLTVMAYRLTGNFPEREIFGLSNQIRRAATSIPGNVAEGFGRKGVSTSLS